MASKPSPFAPPVDLTLEPRFPNSWALWVDEVLPQYVKDRYSPERRA